MIRNAGLDIGSRTIKLAIIEENTFKDYHIIDTGVDALDNCRKILSRGSYDKLVATGYGRYLAQTHLECSVITEIKAYAMGAHHLHPDCDMVIDIGGQDSKIICVSHGKVEDFEMNDRCAAGTGRFLEVMATTLGYSIDEIGRYALQAEGSATINSMCTVFAESEVISLISKGEDPKNIAYGLHNSIANRIYSMLGRIGIRKRVVFAGGVAKNPCMVALLGKRLGQELIIPDEPQLIGSIGAALSANGAL
jgi:predicted CoA-substrate-specific enzyme activase